MSYRCATYGLESIGIKSGPARILCDEPGCSAIILIGPDRPPAWFLDGKAARGWRTKKNEDFTRTDWCPLHISSAPKPHRPKTIQAKSLDDGLVLNVIRCCAHERTKQSEFWREADEVWVFTLDILVNFPEVPNKVLMAKLTKLVKRKLIEGCVCGCRGDFFLTAAGSFLLGSPPPITVKLAFKERP